MKLHGIWDILQDLTHSILIVNSTQLIPLHHNSINQWLIVLKILDLLSLLKLSEYLMAQSLSQKVIVQLQLGIHVECVLLEQLYKEWLVNVQELIKFSLMDNVNVKLDIHKVDLTVYNAQHHKLFKTDNVFVLEWTKY